MCRCRASAKRDDAVFPQTDLQPDGVFQTKTEPYATLEGRQPAAGGGIMTAAGGARPLEEPDLEAALQLLVERAQYITGATGAALALLQEEEMVCRASAGSCAPAVGARLQVRSGLTGESIARRQLLRCDDAETDGRVNLDTCRELGIASIVVLPLISRSGRVLGLFELFSDHANAFEEHDLSALERIAGLTLTALDLAEKRPVSMIVPARAPEAEPPVEPAETSPAVPSPDPAQPQVAAGEPAGLPQASGSLPAPPQEESPVAASAQAATSRQSASAPQPGSVPEAMQRVQKCASCGFPVSEGRTLCVDCEAKQRNDSAPAETMPVEFLPSFATVQPTEESWLGNHVNLLAILVLILSIVVAVVVFR
jgi:putative methionine-R-sulfoxide reductase with GAF domain